MRQADPLVGEEGEKMVWCQYPQGSHAGCLKVEDLRLIGTIHQTPCLKATSSHFHCGSLPTLTDLLPHLTARLLPCDRLEPSCPSAPPYTSTFQKAGGGQRTLHLGKQSWRGRGHEHVYPGCLGLWKLELLMQA